MWEVGEFWQSIKEQICLIREGMQPYRSRGVSYKVYAD